MRIASRVVPFLLCVCVLASAVILLSVTTSVLSVPPVEDRVDPGKCPGGGGDPSGATPSEDSLYHDPCESAPDPGKCPGGGGDPARAEPDPQS